MAMGADRAFHIDLPDKADGGPEPLTIAKMLQAVVKEQNINLVLLGKQAIDGDQGQTGQMLAGLLGWPQATQASKVEVKDEAGTVEVTHEVDGGVETLRAKLPMIITTDLRLNEPRYASLPNIMKAKKKPLEKKTLADLGVEDTRRLKTLKVTGMCPECAFFWNELIVFCRTPGAQGWWQGRGCRRPGLQAQGAWCAVNAQNLLFALFLVYHRLEMLSHYRSGFVLRIPHPHFLIAMLCGEACACIGTLDLYMNENKFLFNCSLLIAVCAILSCASFVRLRKATIHSVN
jgi:hypothetical protein